MPNSFSVHYTGALFGYFQINQPTPEDWKNPALVLDFLKSSNGNPDELLVGMGDNFGPEFRASIQTTTVGAGCALQIHPEIKKSLKGHDEIPEGLYKSDYRVPGDEQVQCDNVADFLMSAGYRVVVPGREDFLYSAAWLRGIALGLRRASDPQNANHSLIKNQEHKLALLAANLRVQTKQKTCPLFFSPKRSANPANQPLRPNSNCTNDAIPKTIAMDWLSRLDLSLNPDLDAEARIENETEFPRAMRSIVHEASTLELRRTLMENQAQQLVSMLDGLSDAPFSTNKKDIDALRIALGTLAKDDNFVLNERRGQDGLTLKIDFAPTSVIFGKDKFRVTNAAVVAFSTYLNGALKCEVAVAPTPLSDLCEVGEKLGQKFASVTTESHLLLDRSARQAGRRLLLRAIAHEQEDFG